MGLSDFVNKIKHEAKVLTGNEGKDMEYGNAHTYPDAREAEIAFSKAKEKLFDVNGWSAMKGINSTFILHDESGTPISSRAKPGYFIKIELPGPKIENWVRITELTDQRNMAEFIVHPSKKPEDKQDPDAEVKHFFTEEASSTFRVLRDGNTIKAFEIGRNEVINNDGDDAGDRSILNTLIAEGGWAGFQKIQWEKLTRFLVHLEED